MTPDAFPFDLVVLAADGQMEFMLKGLFSRPPALGVRPFSCKTIKHPRHDHGCFKEGPDLLRLELHNARHALLVFDREGSGQETRPREELETDAEQRLAANGWGERAKAVVIDPELETWVFAASNKVPQLLHFHGKYHDLRSWLDERGFLPSETGKPARPKDALEALLLHTRLPRSSAIYQSLAEQVSFKQCTDPAFAKLLNTLKTWFPTQ